MSFIANENLNRMSGVAGQALKEGQSYPVKDLKGIGLDIINNDGAVDLVFEITGSTTVGVFTKEYRVPAGATLNSLFPPFTEINVTTPTAKYDIIVVEALP